MSNSRIAITQGVREVTQYPQINKQLQVFCLCLSFYYALKSFNFAWKLTLAAKSRHQVATRSWAQPTCCAEIPVYMMFKQKIFVFGRLSTSPDWTDDQSWNATLALLEENLPQIHVLLRSPPHATDLPSFCARQGHRVKQPLCCELWIWTLVLVWLPTPQPRVSMGHFNWCCQVWAWFQEQVPCRTVWYRNTRVGSMRCTAGSWQEPFLHLMSFSDQAYHPRISIFHVFG